MNDTTLPDKSAADRPTTFQVYAVPPVRAQGPMRILLTSRLLAMASSSTLLVVLLPAGTYAEDPSSYGPARQLAELENEQISESSGLAASRRQSDLFWTHNDSGHDPQLFAFDGQGRNLAEITLEGAQNIDWEDIAAFRDAGRPRLLVGDFGDHHLRRENCTLYLLPEPDVPSIATVEAESFTIVYDDGPHNCEALAVDPLAGDVLLVTKELALICDVYRLPWPLPESEEPLVARRIARLNHTAVTALDISPNGDRAIVLTYLRAYEYSREPEQSWAEAFAEQPRPIAMPERRQGESICYSAEGDSLYLTSEFVPTPLWELPRAEEPAEE